MSTRTGTYTDRWVVDRTLFEYVNQGSCSCCGVSHAVMDVAQFFQLCSDIETDDARREKFSPWPLFMRDELWRDMVSIRAKLKSKLPYYQKFVAEEMDGFEAWWRSLAVKERDSVFQMPVDEVKVIYDMDMNVKKAYRVVLCAVLEQVKRWRETGYPPDGRTEWEMDFEDVLETQRGAFVVHPEYTKSEEGLVSFFGMVRQVGGAKLLPRKPRHETREDDEGEEEGGDADAEEDVREDEDTVSFRGDRRLVRLVIFRYFIDRAIKRFRAAREAETAEEAARPADTLIACTETLDKLTV